MMQPGRETNYPTSSGTVAKGGAMASPLATFGGFTITVGLALLALAVYVLYTKYGKR